MDSLAKVVDGYYVMVWGASRYQSIAWYKDLAEANKHLQHIMAIGTWRGMPPTIQVSWKALN